MNHSVSNLCSVQGIHNCLGTIYKVRDFFIYPKRKDVLKSEIEKYSECVTKNSLKKLCATRWVERYHAVNDFLELFEYVINSLDIISDWITSTQVSNLCTSILHGEFILCLLIVAKGFGLGSPLSTNLQQINIDLEEAMSLAEDTLEELQNLRQNADIEFNTIYVDAKNLANTFYVIISKPRTTGRQTKRCIVETNSPEVCIIYSILGFIY